MSRVRCARCTLDPKLATTITVITVTRSGVGTWSSSAQPAHVATTGSRLSRMPNPAGVSRRSADNSCQ